jgi:hypothetical protein
MVGELLADVKARFWATHASVSLLAEKRGGRPAFRAVPSLPRGSGARDRVVGSEEVIRVVPPLHFL